MGFWIFMTIMDLLIPLVMVIFGSHFRKHAPREINGFYGYRTSRSMKNKDTWEFAHHYSGRLFLRVGVVMLILSAVASVSVLGKSEDTIGILSAILLTIQTAVIIATIFPTEKALKRTFDENGNHRPAA